MQALLGVTPMTGTAAQLSQIWMLPLIRISNNHRYSPRVPETVDKVPATSYEII